MTVLEILDNFQENYNGGVLFRYCYKPYSFIKTGPLNAYSRENFPKFSEQMLFM